MFVYERNKICVKRKMRMSCGGYYKLLAKEKGT